MTSPARTSIRSPTWPCAGACSRGSRSWWSANRGGLSEFGYFHQRLSYQASNTRQVGYGIYAPYTGSLTGPTIDYELSCQAPYLGARLPFAWGRGRWSFNILYSFWLTCRNLDDHLRREEEYPPGSGRITEGKMAEGQARGFLWGASLSGRWPLSERTRLGFAVDYMGMNATGAQKQWYYYADGSTVPLADGIPMTIRASQWAVTASVAIEF